MHAAHLLCLVLLLPLLPARTAMAFDLAPISQVLSPKGSGSSGSYELTNPGADPIAVEVTVVELVKHLDGTEDLSQSAEEDFAIFPPQLVIEPGGTRTIRVRWLGDPKPDHELAYRLVAEQVPVDLHASGGAAPSDSVGQIGLYYTYKGTLFIQPAGARPDVHVEAVRLEASEEGAPLLTVMVGNRGTARGWVKGFELHLEIDGEEHVLTEQDLPGLQELPVLAGGRRQVTLPWPSDVPPVQPTSARIELGR